jgi:hypothetical protein
MGWESREQAIVLVQPRLLQRWRGGAAKRGHVDRLRDDENLLEHRVGQ